MPKAATTPHERFLIRGSRPGVLSQGRRNHLVVMVKVPQAGRVKTRLGRDIGMTAAAWWFRHQVGRLIRRLSCDRRWTLTLAVSPDAEGLQSRVWPPHVRRIPQGRGDLGDRMGRVFRGLPPGPVVIVGADIPGIARSDIAAAFKALGHADAVLGPAPDGGYWLIGLARRSGRLPTGLFGNVRWSGPHALADTVATLDTDNVAYIRALRDVDTVADLQETKRR